MEGGGAGGVLRDGMGLDVREGKGGGFDTEGCLLHWVSFVGCWESLCFGLIGFEESRVE